MPTYNELNRDCRLAVAMREIVQNPTESKRGIARRLGLHHNDLNLASHQLEDGVPVDFALAAACDEVVAGRL